MLYRYETHCHCSQCSLCGGSTSQEMVQSYYDAGYAGLVLTDHFIWGNTSVSRDLPWNERMNAYYGAYLEAKEYAKNLDFDVIFGIEHAYGDGKEMLIYGVDLDFLLKYPNMPSMSIDEVAEAVHSYGGLVIQAHPYRDRGYINMDVGPRIDLVDGFEVYNTCNGPGENEKAMEIAKENGLIFTSGSDNHASNSGLAGSAGIALPYRIKDEKELVSALKNNDHYIITEGKINK